MNLKTVEKLLCLSYLHVNYKFQQNGSELVLNEGDFKSNGNKFELNGSYDKE